MENNSNNTLQTWEQQKNESSRAFHMFEHYRDLEPYRRSVRLAVTEHKVKCKSGTGKVNGNITMWSAKFDWIKRSEDYDRETARVRRLRNQHQLERAMDRDARTVAALKSVIIEKIKALDPDDLEANLMPQMLKMLTEIEYKALGFQDDEEFSDDSIELSINFSNAMDNKDNNEKRIDPAELVS